MLLPVKIALVVLPICVPRDRLTPELKTPGRSSLGHIWIGPAGLDATIGLRLPTEQGENRLGGGIRLGHGRHGRLHQDLRLGEVGRFRRHIRVADAGFGGGEARDLRLRQVDGVLQLVLAGADLPLHRPRW